ncbi:SDR family NAD(P)-dependent oxidoreductase [Gracilibacillus thailandensis]|uniref:SDR family NAD(P)-dependent oxidoreductase n=1 Tax=Gracilibacillus thailandensis TaxID=563735 RepID=A0A6N7R3J8_9BACI|nr:SDR family oxidoreductase [Gracilibacillus thailandensis]MRI67777.1 SDR family NAD(P)-dependent oxidoreductase [Gracilibacillus thailandensis]
MNQLKEKHVLITGASSGIGEALAFALAEQKAIPVLVARTESKLIEIARRIDNIYGIKPIAYPVDITDLKEWQKALDQILKECGKIDILINNAGVGYFEAFDQLNWKQIDNMIRLNLDSLFFTTYYTLPTLMNQPVAHIVNIGSQAGKIATPKSAVYSATKASVISFSNALRMELEGKIPVTSVNIGPVKTAFFETADPKGDYQRSVAKHMLDPNDVANHITKCLFKNKREINLPFWMHAGSKLYQNFPQVMETILKPAFKKK